MKLSTSSRWGALTSAAALIAAGCLGDAGVQAGLDAGFFGPDAGDARHDAGPGAGIDAGAPSAEGPTRYAADAVRSPITASVVERLREILAASDALHDGTFMKVGASGTVSSHFLHCLSGEVIDLDGRDELRATIEAYDAPLAAGSSSWARESLAAEVGRTASWAIAGDPSPLEQEIAAIDPLLALVNYGTNDMGLGSTYETALWPFYENFSRLLDQLEEEGIIPIVTGLNPRADREEAAAWVPTYNAVTRAIAEARRLPYIDLYLASVVLPDMGLLSDGIHGNVYRDGVARPCVFTEEALEFNYNVRNLLTLQALSDVRDAAILGRDAPDADTAGYEGRGAPDDPFVIDTLPFSHHADTSLSPHARIDGYPACDAGQDQSGPEFYYRLELSEATPVRIMVLDRGSTDIDLHLLAGSAEPSACIARGHRIIERSLEPGTYYVVADSFVGAGGEVHAGSYSLVIVACEAGDERCE
jgi:hypothetical protein